MALSRRILREICRLVWGDKTWWQEDKDARTTAVTTVFNSDEKFFSSMKLAGKEAVKEKILAVYAAKKPSPPKEQACPVKETPKESTTDALALRNFQSAMKNPIVRPVSTLQRVEKYRNEVKMNLKLCRDKKAQQYGDIFENPYACHAFVMDHMDRRDLESCCDYEDVIQNQILHLEAMIQDMQLVRQIATAPGPYPTLEKWKKKSVWKDRQRRQGTGAADGFIAAMNNRLSVCKSKPPVTEPVHKKQKTA